MGLPKALRDVDSVRNAVQEASDFALEHKIPLTIERLAYTLGMATEELSRAANGHKFDLNSGDKVTEEVAQTLKMAIQLSVAQLVEHGLVKQGIFDMFLLKCNHKYNDKPEPQANINTVVFVGSDNLKD